MDCTYFFRAMQRGVCRLNPTRVDERSRRSGNTAGTMNQKTLPLLTFALGILLMRLLARENRTHEEIDLVTRLRQAGAL